MQEQRILFRLGCIISDAEICVIICVELANGGLTTVKADTSYLCSSDFGVLQCTNIQAYFGEGLALFQIDIPCLKTVNQKMRNTLAEQDPC